jgi:hypothetical protein
LSEEKFLIPIHLELVKFLMCYRLDKVLKFEKGACYCHVSHGDTVRNLKLDWIKNQFDEEEEKVSVE